MDKKTQRWWDFLSAFFLLAALEVSAYRLRVTGWTPNLGIIVILTFISTFLGLALGYSSFRPWFARLFGLVYTLFFVPFEIGLFEEPSGMDWLARLNDLYARLYYSLFDFFRSKPVQDPLLFLTVMAIFFWLIGLIAGYLLTRHAKPWGPLIVSGLALLIIDFYTPYTANRDRYSGIFVFLSLLLVARQFYLRSRRSWAEKGTTYDPEVGANLGRTVLVSGLVLVFIAWNIPILVQALTPGTEIQKQLANQWETIRDKLQNAVAGLQSPAVATSDFYGDSLSLGAGGTRDQEIVFTIKLDQPLPAGVRFYWKARSYDTFNGTWTNTVTDTKTVRTNQWPFTYPQWDGRTVVDLTFTPQQNNIRNLYLPEFPLTIGHNVDVMGKTLPDGTFDFVGILANPALNDNQSLSVRAWVTATSIEQISAASTNYPAYIRNTYLQLPADFSPRIRQLAFQIAGRLPTQYEKVMAITDWLRTNITYQEAIDTPPQGVDPIVWFLFDYKKGFCNYYATAEVLMLRSLGIPARLGVGYAQGTYDSATNTFTVRRQDSHAWPEVYFDGLGWVEFEPTAAQPPTQLPATNPNQSNSGAISPAYPSPLDSTAIARRPEFDLTPTTTVQPRAPYADWRFLVPLALLLGTLALVIWLQDRGKIRLLKHPIPVLIERNLERRGWRTPAWLEQWARLSELSPIERLYSRLGLALPILGRRTGANQTPAERLHQLMEAMPEARQPIQDFLTEYERAEYSYYPADYSRASRASQQVWWYTRRAFFRRLLQRPRQT